MSEQKKVVTGMNENLFCTYCQKEFSRIYDLYEHLVADGESYKFECSDCDWQGNAPLRHVDDSGIWLTCPVCKQEVVENSGHNCTHGTAINVISSLISRFCFDKHNKVIKPEKKERFPAYDKTKI